MSTTVTFGILYLLPILTFAGTLAAYLLAYGKRLDSPMINFTFYILVISFIASSFIAVKLISQLLSSGASYWAIFFTVLGWLLAIIPLASYQLMFK
jgi:hypothetical protein